MNVIHYGPRYFCRLERLFMNIIIILIDAMSIIMFSVVFLNVQDKPMLS